jgi:hypothetical protein
MRIYVECQAGEEELFPDRVKRAIVICVDNIIRAVSSLSLAHSLIGEGGQACTFSLSTSSYPHSVLLLREKLETETPSVIR